MSFNGATKSYGSRLIPRRNGSMPAIERTETEKIRIAQKFLENRGFTVLPKLITGADVAEYIGCSISHLKNLLDSDDFPKPFDIGSQKRSIDSKRIMPRWSVSDISAWVEARKVI